MPAKGSAQRIRVTLPKDVSAADLSKVNELLINKVIKGLTGCACLSGVHEVILQQRFENVIKASF